MKTDWTVKALLIIIALLLGAIVFRQQPVHAQTARFDYIRIVSAGYLYKGEPGLLLLDERTGNVWYMQKTGEKYGDLVFLIRIPFEKIPLQPQQM